MSNLNALFAGPFDYDATVILRVIIPFGSDIFLYMPINFCLFQKLKG